MILPAATRRPSRLGKLPLFTLVLCAVGALPWSAMHGQVRKSTKAIAAPAPSGPTVVLDTTLGRVTCSLYRKQAPATADNFVALATGTKDWTDAATGTVMHSKPFYDGTAIFAITDGIISGDRMGGGKGVAGAPFAAEKSGIGFERAGRLVMAAIPPGSPADKSAPGQTNSSLFYITGYANAEFARRGGTVFGQCDDASLPVVRELAHTLLSSDNHPATPLGINHITVLQPGESVPAVADAVPPASITPQPGPMPIPAIAPPEPTGPTAIIDIAVNAKPLGQMTCRLFKDETPIGTANFIGLVNGTKDWKSPATHQIMHGKRFYDGLSFARVIPDFMVQNADLPGDPKGGGEIGIKFDNEVVPGLTFDRPGRLAYANAGPGTNSSEFFVTEHAVHRLDGLFTIFGQCDDASVKLVEAIARMPRDEHNKPLTRVVIRRITIAQK